VLSIWGLTIDEVVACRLLVVRLFDVLWVYQSSYMHLLVF